MGLETLQRPSVIKKKQKQNIVKGGPVFYFLNFKVNSREEVGAQVKSKTFE